MDRGTRSNGRARHGPGTELGKALQWAIGPAPALNHGKRARQNSPASVEAGPGIRLLAATEARATRLADMLRSDAGLSLYESAVLDARLPQAGAALAARATEPGVLLVEAVLPARDLLRLVRRHRAARGVAWLVLLSAERDPVIIDELLAAGASGVIPDNYDAAAIGAALQVVKSGQCFRPHLRSARREKLATTPAPAAPAAPTTASRAARSGVDVQADRPLSPAEMDVCRLVAEHLTDRQIAEIRGTGRGTVRSQVNNLLRKLGCKRRDEAGEIYRRLYEIDDKAVQLALRGETVNLDWLVGFMDVEQARAGDVLFRRGQTAKKLYYIESGQVRLPEIDAVMGPGVVFGEIGIFAPDHKRMHTAECVTDATLRTMDATRVWRYYQLKPQFAVQVLCLITRRLLADITRLRS